MKDSPQKNGPKNGARPETVKRETIARSLAAVRTRCRIQRVFNGICRGFLLGSPVAFPLVIVQIAKGTGTAGILAPLAVVWLVGIVLGTLFGWFLPIDPHESARRTDRHYGLKDRLLTAMNLSPKPESTVMERLQLDDAARHAERIDPQAVAPYRLPTSFSWALGTAILALAVGLVAPYWSGHHDAQAAQQLPEVVSSVQLLREDLVEKLELLVADNPEEAPLRELSEKMKELLARLDDASTDRKESLSTLSEMEQAIRAAMSEFNLEAVDASMKDIAEALSAAEATRAASQAMKEGNYSRASEELEKLDSDFHRATTKPERRAVAEQMKQALKKMESRGQQSLLGAAQKMSDGMEQGDCKEGAGDLAGECKKQSLRKGIAENLEGKLALLGLCKSECNGGARCESNKNGGEDTSKSDQASKNWGTGEAGNPTSGEETSLDGVREQKRITGMMGEGESDKETLNSNDAPEHQLTQSLKNAFQEYRKMSEAVLETEPIPLGQRQMIRRYFESIRPNDSEQ